MADQNKQKSGARVVLLEDEDVLGKLYEKKLEEAGYDVKLYADADELRAGLDGFIPDLAFLDHALHGDNKAGIHVIEDLRKSNPQVKVVMLSNYSEFQMEQAAKDAGADDYLLKINTPPAMLAQHAEKLLS